MPSTVKSQASLQDCGLEVGANKKSLQDCGLEVGHEIATLILSSTRTFRDQLSLQAEGIHVFKEVSTGQHCGGAA